MDDPAYSVLGGKLTKIKRSNVGPAWLGKELLAAEIVDVCDAERASDAQVPTDVRLAELVEMVLGNGAPGVFQTLVGILLRKPHLKWLAKDLKGTYALFFPFFFTYFYFCD